MRKHLLFLTALLLSTQMVFAQDTPKEKKGLQLINFSIGPSFSNIISNKNSHKIYTWDSTHKQEIAIADYDTDIFEDIKTGITLSTGFEYYIKNNFSLNVALSYENKGFDLNYKKKRNIASSTQIIKHNMDISYDYLTLPISIKKYFNGKFYLQGGIYGSYLLSSKYKVHTKILTATHIDKIQDKNAVSYSELTMESKDKTYTKDFDFGVLLGMGVSERISEKLFFNGNILFNIGLVEIDKKFEKKYYPPTTKPVSRTTHYYGHLSNVKNIACTVNIGLAYQL